MRIPPAAFLGLLSLIAPLVAQTHNTLVLIADDVGVDAIAAYRASNSPPPTPHLDALAARGVLFRRCWANPVCSPTRASVMTGRHAFRTGIGNAIAPNAPGLAYSETLLPELLTAAHVGNALIGKWHLGTRSGNATPSVAGWSHFVGAMGAAIPSYTSWTKVENGVASSTTAYATTFVVDEALAFVATRTEPWCVVVAFHAGHSPFHAPPAHLHTQNLAGLSPTTTPRPFLTAMVQAMDTEIGRLLASLPPAVRDRTNLIFLGDNGTPSAVTYPPLPTNHAKGTLYEGGVHVPLIVAGPVVANGGRAVDALVHACDLFATVGDLHGIDVRAAVPSTTALDCVALTPYLRNPNQPPLRTHVYTELFGTGFGLPRDFGWAIRDDRYKWIRWDQRTPPGEAFFDLTADPYEQNDLLGRMNATERARYEDLRAAAARLRGESFAIGFGVGCTGGSGVPTLAATAGPERGATFALTAGNLAPSVTTTLFALGASRERHGLLPLPLDLTPIAMPGCSLRVALDFALALPSTGGTATWHLAIPNQSALLGGALFFQAFVPEPGANGAGIVTTAGVMTVIG